jgi:hypothetical protein
MFESDPATNISRSLLSFQTISDFLGIDLEQLLKGLKSLDGSELPRRRYRLQHNGRSQILARD